MSAPDQRCFFCTHSRSEHSRHMPAREVVRSVPGTGLHFPERFTVAATDECTAPGCSCIAFYMFPAGDAPPPATASTLSPDQPPCRSEGKVRT